MIPDMTEHDAHRVGYLEDTIDNLRAENTRLINVDISVQKRMEILNGMLDRSLEHKKLDQEAVQKLLHRVGQLTTEVEQLRHLRSCGNCRYCYVDTNDEPCGDCVNASEWKNELY